MRCLWQSEQAFNDQLGSFVWIVRKMTRQQSAPDNFSEWCFATGCSRQKLIAPSKVMLVLAGDCIFCERHALPPLFLFVLWKGQQDSCCNLKMSFDQRRILAGNDVCASESI
jgi:hypothetical protein